MSRRLMLRNASGGGGILPPEYQQVEWVGKTTGSAYLWLNNIVLKNGDVLKFVLKKTDSLTSEQAFFGQANTGMPAIQNPSGSAFEAYIQNGTYRWWKYNNIGFSAAISSSALAEFDIVEYTLSSYKDTEYATLFAYRADRYLWFGKMFDVEFRRSDNSVYAKYVPCYRKSDGEIGMYDIVSGAFFANVGTGTFVKGADVN